MDHNWTTRLRDAGLRVTAPRVATLDVISHAGHIDADHAVIQVRERLGTVSRQAIYDILHAFVDAGLVRSQSTGRKTVYELETGDNHHHLYCVSCGALQNVSCHLETVPCLEPTDTHGFQILSADVVYRGVCATCQTSPTRKDHS